MNSIKLNKATFNNIKTLKYNMIILENENLENEEKVIIQNETTGEEIFARITAKNTFTTLKDALKVIPTELLGNVSSYKSYEKRITVYRIKLNINIEVKDIIQDSEIYKLIDIDSVKEIKLGRSTSKVFKTKMKEKNKEVILKIQYLPDRISLKEEYERLLWLQNKINSPRVYYWNEKNEYKYLIMEYKNGIPAFKYNDIGYRLGLELKKIHDIDITECKFSNNSTNLLLSNCLEKIEAVFPEVHKKYKNETMKSIIEFLNKNIPKDKVLVHGDYSLPNILINKEIYNFIDLGNVSISTKYFDFYYFLRSLKINKKEYMINDFLKGYGIKKLESKYIKWMDIIDKSLY